MEEEKKVTEEQDIVEETAEASEEAVTDTEEVQEADTDAADAEETDAQLEDADTVGEAETAEEKASGDKEDTAKKSFFKKKKDKKDEQIEELNDRLKRQMAEFDNFRKRSEKEKSQMFDMGAKTIIEKILPVVDNFERGLAAVPEEQKDDAFVSGVDKVYKQLMTELEAAGVKPIVCIGEEFNPEYHNAVMQVESEEFETGVVAQELLKGYTYKDTVVRHSMVAVVS